MKTIQIVSKLAIATRKASTANYGDLRQGSHFHGPKVAHENTYQLEPSRKFQSFKAKWLAQAVVARWLKEGTPYTQETACTMATVISNDLLHQLKALPFDRYRYVIQTYIGQKRLQGMQVSSRAICDGNLDSFAEYLFENKSLYCLVIVHGMYFE